MEGMITGSTRYKEAESSDPPVPPPLTSMLTLFSLFWSLPFINYPRERRVEMTCLWLFSFYLPIPWAFSCSFSTAFLKASKKFLLPTHPLRSSHLQIKWIKYWHQENSTNNHVIKDVIIVHRGSSDRCGWTFNHLSHDGVTLRCWSWRALLLVFIRRWGKLFTCRYV